MIHDEDRKSFRSLMDELRAGSEEAAWELVQQYAPHVRRVVRHRLESKMRSVFDSEDFVQDVWASLIRIKPNLNDINEPKQFVAFLARMAKNKVSDESRKKRSLKRGGDRQQQALDSQIPGSTAIMRPHDRPSQIAIAEETRKDLLAGQSALRCKIIELKEQGYTIVEVADQLGVDERTVRRHLKQLSDRSNESQSSD